MNAEIRVLEDPAAAAGDLLAEAAVAGANLALSGGSTVGRAYAAAAARRGAWPGVHVWFGDERAVPPDHEDSNYRLVRETLLDALDGQPAVHRVLGERPLEEAAALYDSELDGVAFDLVLNGIGTDGHTASLFPAAPALDESERRAVAAEAGLEPFVPRVTLTRPVFAAAEVLVYLVTGEAKAEAVRSAFAAEPSARTPASLVRGRRTIALLDAAAASLLR
ncbi:MAG: 6-phosphogluconolactonase [Actinobacteria bacterium]|nr:6-phosphogluconolactonase [Actinomycetota bacterium]